MIAALVYHGGADQVILDRAGLTRMHTIFRAEAASHPASRSLVPTPWLLALVTHKGLDESEEALAREATRLRKRVERLDRAEAAGHPRLATAEGPLTR